MPSDGDLLARVLGRDDRGAFSELVLRHQSAVRQFLRHLSGGDAALADDLAQETFLQAYRGLKNFHGRSAFQTWLLGIAHNHWRNARRQQSELVPLESIDSANTSIPAAEHTDLSHDLTAALLTLTPHERLAIHLNYEQGLSHSEISALADWPVGTVKTQLARAKDKLRLTLAVWNPRT